MSKNSKKLSLLALCVSGALLTGCSSSPKAPSSDAYSSETAVFLAEQITPQVAEGSSIWQVQLSSNKLSTNYSGPDKSYTAEIDENQRVKTASEDLAASGSKSLSKSLQDYASDLATFATDAKNNCAQPDLRVYAHEAISQDIYLGTCGLSDDQLKIGDLNLSKSTDFYDHTQFAGMIQQFSALTDKPLTGVRIGQIEEGKQGIYVEYANEFSIGYSVGTTSAFSLKKVDSDKKRPEFSASDLSAEAIAKVYGSEAEAAGGPVQLLIYKDSGQDKIVIAAKHSDGTTRVFDNAGEHLVDA
ncbi:hypothetical protein HMPREF9306_01345 [Propionimicrobium lymphophilum ACS-093-V-SCH5]|uniref:Lipoprotein n=1 Tax=Propionimicrobium lymphophilum ACS-093-V-SCH5 TaxID=883161 RepID=S2W0J8_9ACTN|nr:hypothetical protein [Propionimicrobium lymphophilum]EPD32646.1 hypothetical protein HMPREF9306_01345 [Propionimicrobium lymphophilum ACS-093-V-SCH5]